MRWPGEKAGRERFYREHLEAGLCRCYDKNDVVEGKTLCAKCLERTAARMRALRAERRARGIKAAPVALCRCNASLPPGRKACAVCIEAQRDKRRRDDARRKRERRARGG